MTIEALVGIRAVRSWLPPDRVSARQAVTGEVLTAEQAEAHGEVAVGIATDDDPPVEMAARACVQALRAAGCDAQAVDLLLYSWTNYQGNDFFSPQHWLADRLGLSGRCNPVTVQQACNGAAATLELAIGAVRSGRAGTALIAAGDRFGAPGLDHWRSHPMLAHGDGAVAAVVAAPAPADEFHVLGLAHAAAADLWRTRDTGKLALPGRQVPDFIDSRPTEIFLALGGRDLLLRRGTESMHAAVTACLDEAGGIPLEKVDAVLLPRLSPGVRRLMVGVYEEHFGPAAHSYYSRTGHLGSGDLLANLADVVEDDLVAPGGLALLLNAGGGYSYSAALVRRGPKTCH
ncbi:MAG TPA: 3-oxoacyl-[acyl-carrier-protein] synthase III C-terminal domain-containing protein [Kineosporiaceae bacterium]|nr:3-oxoacyl-[acyl-carrier-protein] synthase III C-terminal domain-containing protein [Kineosporiaceae bacterium]